MGYGGDDAACNCRIHDPLPDLPADECTAYDRLDRMRDRTVRMQYLPATVICDYGNVQKMHYAFCSILYRDRAGTSVSDEADRMAEKAVHKIYQESNQRI